MRSFLRDHGLRVALPCVAVALAATLLAPAASAREYKVDEFDRKLSARGALAKKYARSPNPGTPDEQEFRAYIERYFFPAMTQTNPEALEDLGRSRYELFKSYLWNTSGPTQAYLNEQAEKFAIRVLGGKGYHPSVRYNALLILGQLDDVYASAGEATPTPHAKANGALANLVERARTSAKRPRYELAGALVGLERHTRYFGKLPGKNKSLTAKAIYKLLADKELAGAYAPEVKDWIYLKAATAMANIGVAGPKGAFMMAIARRVSDDSLTNETRAAIAAQLARVKAKPGDFDAAPAVAAVRGLAAEIAEAEADIAKQIEATVVRRGRGVIVANEREKTARRLKQEDRKWSLVRNGLLEELVDLRKGVRAVGELADVDDKIAMASIDEALRGAIEQISDEATVELNVARAIREMAKQIAAAQPAEAAEEADEAALAEAGN